MQIKTEKIYVPCDCGCTIIEICKYDYPESSSWKEDYDINFYVNAYYSDQRNSFLNKLKTAWNIIKKGTYMYQSILLTKEQYQEFVNKSTILLGE